MIRSYIAQQFVRCNFFLFLHTICVSCLNPFPRNFRPLFSFPLEVFCLSCHCVKTRDIVVRENTRRSAVSEITVTDPSEVHNSVNRSKSFKSLFFPMKRQTAMFIDTSD